MKEYLRYSLCFLFLTFTGGLVHAEETDTLTEESVVAEMVQDKTWPETERLWPDGVLR